MPSAGLPRMPEPCKICGRTHGHGRRKARGRFPVGTLKAEKVKAWREANPEAYAEQKRRNAEKQAKKRAEREKAE